MSKKKSSDKKKKVSGKIPQKNKIFEFVNEYNGEVSVKTILERLKLPKTARTKLKRVLRELVFEEKLVRSRNKYMLPTKSKMITGKVDIKTDFGFLVNTEGEDVFLGRQTIKNLLPGDEIEIYTRKSRRGGTEGVLKRIVTRSKTPVMCKVSKVDGLFFAVLAFKETPVIKLLKTDYKLRHGDIILVNIVQDGASLNGDVVAHLDDDGNIDLLKKFILSKYEIPGPFHDDLLSEANAIKPGVMSPGREDLRDEIIITIDPYDAKDYDDAVSLRKEKGIYHLGVHIADVTAYLKEGMLMDEEAHARGVSTYLPGHVIPMLPEKLSNNICSLVGGEDRLTFSIFMRIDEKGDVLDYSIKETIINNKKRFTYEEAEDIIKGKQPFKDKKMKDMLLMMNELKNILKGNLVNGGMIDFTLGEPVLEYDEKGEVNNIKRKESLDAHRLIEFFMIYANICSADYIMNQSDSGMFRIHPDPSRKDIEEFNIFSRAMGFSFEIKKGESHEFQKIAAGIVDSPKRYFMERKLLRTMQLAKYSDVNTGHFGLGIPKYTHFTSPIRRYADVIVHRLIKHYLKAEAMADTSKKYLKSMAADIVVREEKSEKAERDIFKLYALNFLKKMVGLSMMGFISKITKTGLVVELEEYPIEGFIDFESISGDYIVFDEYSQMATGKRTKKKYKLGDKFSVIISSVKLESLKLSLEIEE